MTELVLEDDEEEIGIEGKDPEVEGSATTDGPWRKRAAVAAVAAAVPAPAPVPTPESAAITREDEEKKEDSSSEGGLEENGLSAAAPIVEEGEGEATAPASDGPAKYVPPSMRKAMEAAAATGRPAMPTPIDIFAVRPLSEGSGGGEAGVKGAYVPPGRRSGATGPSCELLFIYCVFSLKLLGMT